MNGILGWLLMGAGVLTEILMSLPQKMGFWMDTTFTVPVFQVSVSTTTSSSQIQGNLAVLVENISNLSAPVLGFVEALSVTLGVILVVKGLVKLKHLSDFRNMTQGQAEIGKAVALMGLGSGFIWMPYLFEVFTYSVFGMDIDSLQRTYNVATGASQNYQIAAFRIAMVIGVISVLRGWMLLVNSTQGHAQQGTLGKAFVHIFSGLLLFHAQATLTYAENTLGLSFF
jgi:hypothetical protein